jgi:hypothetical protein
LSTNDPTLATNYPPADSQLTYLEKYLYGLNPLTNDTDGDGLTDYAEIFVYHTNPLIPPIPLAMPYRMAGKWNMV